MKSVWKFPLRGALGETIALQMPTGAEILHFAMQSNTPTIWALVDPAQTLRTVRRFYIVGTGMEIDSADVRYVGTIPDGLFVWHAFELR